MKYTKEILQDAVNKSNTLANVLRILGLKQAGGSQTHIRNMIQKFNIDASHFVGQSHGKGQPSISKKTSHQILILRPDSDRRQKREQLHRALIQIGVPYECNVCNQQPIWLGNVLTLDIDYINGNWLDDRQENLRFLCPNCHSQYSRNLLAK